MAIGNQTLEIFGQSLAVGRTAECREDGKDSQGSGHRKGQRLFGPHVCSGGRGNELGWDLKRRALKSLSVKPNAVRGKATLQD